MVRKSDHNKRHFRTVWIIVILSLLPPGELSNVLAKLDEQAKRMMPRISDAERRSSLWEPWGSIEMSSRVLQYDLSLEITSSHTDTAP